MPDLVALDLAAGPAFVTALGRIWDDGDAALPIDGRLPAPARQALLAAMRPAACIDATGRQTIAGGVPVLGGDALVIATSGTTGDPKGVVLTHDALRASSIATSARLHADPSHDRWLACLPLAHVGGLAVIVRALHTATPLVVLPAFDAAAVDAAASGRDAATLVSLVPTALARIDATRWRAIVLGGSAMPPGLPANVVRTYGLTETGSGVVYDGRPLAGVEIRVDDGEVHLRAPMLLRAYRGATPEGVDPRRPDGWFATGDAGWLDADGTLAVRGRIGDVIVTGGEKVWPEAVERILRDAPGVADVAVAGRVDPEWGSRVVAFVVPVDTAGGPSLESLRDAVRAALPAYCAPRELVTVRSIPRTAIGKIRRGELADLAPG